MDEISSKEESPPPYENDDMNISNDVREAVVLNEPNRPHACEDLDLLANCKITDNNNLSSEEVEDAEIAEMGIWHSTPLPGRHKSSISLAWALKKNIETSRTPKDAIYVEDIKKKIQTRTDENRYQRQIQRLHENELQRKCKRSGSKHNTSRVVGRSEYYNNYRLAVTNGDCDECFYGGQDVYSEDTSVGTAEYDKKRLKHKHKKRRSRQSGRFGYDIRDLDHFLSEASIDIPGNIPVVVAYPSVLYQTHGGVQNEIELPLGTVVNAIFKNKQWLYVQTPHAEEGYIMYSACLPLGILPNTKHTQQKDTPCWESSTDIYPRPCGNLTDTEKEQLRGRTKSECRYRTSSASRTRTKNAKSLCGERDFDSLYLKSKSIPNINKYDLLLNKNWKEDKELARKKVNRNCVVSRQTLLVVSKDYTGSLVNKTLSVQQGEVVTLIQDGGVETDVDSEWFYVRRKNGQQGFIPAEIAGHGYI